MYMTIPWKTGPNRDLALYGRLFLWARPYWPHLAGVFLLSLLATPLALLVPLPLKIALDSGLGSKPLPHLFSLFVPAGFRLSPSSALLFAVGLLIAVRSEEHTSELQSRLHLVCRLLLAKKNQIVCIIANPIAS